MNAVEKQTELGNNSLIEIGKGYINLLNSKKCLAI